MRRLGGAIVGLCFACAACVRTLPGQDAPAGALLYYPNRMALSADNNSLFVVNTNFDERYNVGWLTRVDLKTLLPLLDAAVSQGRLVDSNAAKMALRQSIRVPSLGGDLVIDAAHRRAYLAHRGQGLITTLDLSFDAAGQLDIGCGDKSAPAAQMGLTHLEQQTSCDRAHLFDINRALAASSLNAETPSGSDPFALALVPLQREDYPALMVGFLGNSSLLALQPAARAQDLSILKRISLGGTALGHLLPIAQSALSPLGGSLLGTTHVTPEQGGRGLIYALDVSGLLAQPTQSQASLVPYDLGKDLGATAQPADIVGVSFSSRDPTRLYVAHRGPSAVVMLERSLQSSTSFDADGQLQSRQTAAFAYKDSQAMGDGRLSQIAYIQRDVGDVVAVLSLAGDMLYLFDVSGDSLLLRGRFAFGAGQGPVDLAHVVDAAHHYLFVTTFFDHGLTVLDISSANLGDIRLAASIYDDAP